MLPNVVWCFDAPVDAVFVSRRAGLRDAFIYLQELVATGCAQAEHFTIVANGCKRMNAHPDDLELLRDLLRGCDSVDMDYALQNALHVRR